MHDKWGFIDREGKIVIAPKFGDARWSFSEGLAAVKFGSKWGYINVRGDFAIPPRFEYAQGFAGGRAIVLIGKKHGVIDRTGKLVSHLYDSSWGYIDENGAIVIPLRFRQALGFSQGLAAVEFGDGQNQWGYIDHGGRAVIDPRFSEQSALSARNQVRYRLIHTILG